jgi:hypothetical protein
MVGARALVSVTCARTMLEASVVFVWEVCASLGATPVTMAATKATRVWGARSITAWMYESRGGQ